MTASTSPILARGSVALAFDLSGDVGAVALAVDGCVVGRVSLGGRKGHAAKLIPATGQLLRANGLERDRLSDVVVGEGPGSFTGVRIAAATAKGLVRTLDARLWAVSSLAATALTASGPEVRYVLFDARRERVFGACYRVAERRSIEEVIAPHAGELHEVLAHPPPKGAIFVGSGARRHRKEIVGSGYGVEVPPASAPSPEGLLRYLHMSGGQAPVSDVGAWEPRYLRPWRPSP